MEDERGRLQVLKLITEIAGDGPQLAEHLERVRLALPQHPALLPLTEVGLSPEGVYLTSPVVTAPTVEGRLRGGRQSLEATLPWLRAITAGMQAAHDAGVWHGAIHPRDVLITDEGGMLTGVGVAPVLESLDMQAPVRVPFTAPERASGRPWDARADQYSLAMLALDALSGRRLIAGTIPAFDRWTLAETPTEDARLHDVFVRALHPDPDQRFASVEAWLLALAGDQAPAEAGALSRFAREGVILATPAVDSSRDIAVQPIEDPEGVALSLFPEEEDTALAAVEEPAGAEVVPTAEEEPEQEWLVADVPAEAQDQDPLVLRSSAGPAEEPPNAAAPTWRLDDHDTSDATLPAWTPEPADAPSRRVWLLLAVVLAVVAAGYGTWRSLQAPPTTAPTTATAPPPDEAAPSPRPAPDPRAGAVTPPAASRPPTVPQAPVMPRGDSPRTEAARPARPATALPPPSAAPPAAAPAVATGRVLIRSSPSGEVRVNGELRGETPVVLRDLPLGPYTVSITRPGFEPVERQVVLAVGQPVASLSVDLVRQAASAAPPAGSGAAPSRPATPPAPAPTSSTAQGTGAVPPARAPATSPDPEAPRTGGIFVVSTPTQARLTIDGQYYGSTPAAVPGLTQGAHTVRVEAPGFKPWEGRVAVIGGTRVRVQATLQQEQE
ncbi:hypothetical protein TBR22_A33010 [Luteitalea sp. TBR-22]|uniref:PEGA domain-containing protein n=1 Tax=Luteitalea sp. TBR-22 TaxID=2802971 RepID=UPI001AF4AD00|nr:PEGA domain-containing protein [Luteitalea sp. TBR-22]BCS34072.1 hypothetical protein TBR22_A33010 [Luteitalea sp. TBR-22]